MTLQIHNTTRKEVPEQLLSDAVRLVLDAEGFTVDSIVGVYCGNKMIQRINREFLGHDYPTDTVTFRYSKEREVDGEFYISLDVVRENALRFSTEFQQELLRVTIHSALHLIGYDDQSPEEGSIMQEKETFYIGRLVQNQPA
ncbi:MAG: rRNA maturation RNase YbeY [Chlorobiaceae bacterium]|nr:rRNA maturation RNase YbeY [Chlorobiaceae bacterium]